MSTRPEQILASRTLLALAATCALASASAPAAAAAAAPTDAPARSAVVAPAEVALPASVAALIADLASPDFATRDRASAELVTRRDDAFRAVEAALIAPGLTPEQEARLTTAARELFVQTPRGALGVQFNTAAGATIIAQLIPGFPAAQTLKPGDEILRVDGVSALMPTAWGQARGVRPMVIARDPGDTIRAAIRREGREIELDVQLGRFNDLRGQPLSGADLAEGWALRWARLREARAKAGGGGGAGGADNQPGAASIGALLPAPEEPAFMPPGMGYRQQPLAPLTPGPTRPGLVAGGQPAWGRPNVSSVSDGMLADQAFRIAQRPGAFQQGPFAPGAPIARPGLPEGLIVQGDVQGQIVIERNGQREIIQIGPNGQINRQQIPGPAINADANALASLIVRRDLLQMQRNAAIMEQQMLAQQLELLPPDAPIRQTVQARSRGLQQELDSLALQLAEIERRLTQIQRP
jgi:hypothetical protein